MTAWKILAIYIARQFFVWCVGVFVAMTTIVFLLDYIELIRRGGTHANATLLILLKMALLKQPFMAQQIMPFAILFGAMIAFWRMTRSNELIVARAAGVSVWQFLAPPVIVALAIGVFAVTVFNPIASVMQTSYEKLEARIFHDNSEQLSVSRAGLWLRQSDRQGTASVIHAERLAPGAGITLEDLLILFFDKQDHLIARIDAKKATLDEGYWDISDGTRWEPAKAPEPFTHYRVETAMTAGEIRESFATPESMSFWELPGFISLLEQSGFPTQRHRLYYNALLARPFLLAAMVLIAAPFSLRMHRRGGVSLMIASGIASGFVLYLLSNVVFALGLSATIPVDLAAWTPAGVSLLTGASLLLHLEDG